MIIPSDSMKKINNYLNTIQTYSKITIKEQNSLLKLLKEINNGDVKILPSQLIDIRDCYVYLLSKTKGTLTHRLGSDIYKDYSNKMSITDIAKKYNVPSINVLYQILIEKKQESHVIYKTITHLNSLQNGFKSQIGDIINNSPSYWYYKAIPNIHNKIKNKYVTKYDMKKNGKSPDILFIEPLQYKRKMINWIVFKPYILFDNKLHYNDIKKVINNFQHLGNGIILYNDIICTQYFMKKININIDTYQFINE